MRLATIELALHLYDEDRPVTDSHRIMDDAYMRHRHGSSDVAGRPWVRTFLIWFGSGGGPLPGDRHPHLQEAEGAREVPGEHSRCVRTVRSRRTVALASPRVCSGSEASWKVLVGDDGDEAVGVTHMRGKEGEVLQVVGIKKRLG